MTQKKSISLHDGVLMIAVIGILVLSVWLWKQTASETLPMIGLMLICLIVTADNFYSLTHGQNNRKMQRRLTMMGIGSLVVFLVILICLLRTV